MRVSQQAINLVVSGRGIFPLLSSPPSEFAIHKKQKANSRGLTGGAGRNWNWMMHKGND